MSYNKGRGRSFSDPGFQREEEKQTVSSRYDTYPGSPGRYEHAGVSEQARILLGLTSEIIKRVEAGYIPGSILTIILRLIKESLTKIPFVNCSTQTVLNALRDISSDPRQVPTLFGDNRIFFEKADRLLSLHEQYGAGFSIIRMPVIPAELNKLFMYIETWLFIGLLPIKSVDELPQYMDCSYAPISPEYSTIEVAPPFPIVEIRNVMADESVIGDIIKHLRGSAQGLVNFLRRVIKTPQQNLEGHLKLARLATLFKKIQNEEFKQQYKAKT